MVAPGFNCYWVQTPFSGQEERHIEPAVWWMADGLVWRALSIPISAVPVGGVGGVSWTDWDGMGGGRDGEACLWSSGDWDWGARQNMAVCTDAGPTAFAAGQIYDEGSRPMLAAYGAWREVLEEIVLWVDRGVASQTDPFRVPCVTGLLVDRGPG